MRQLFLLFFTLCAISSVAQDVIVKRDGTTILAKVMKVGEKEVEYKKINSNADRVYTISVGNLLTINYEDGEVERFASLTDVQAKKQDDTPTAATPSADNASIIAGYNKIYDIKTAAGTKPASFAMAFLGVDPNSVMSCADLDVTLVYTGNERAACGRFFGDYMHCGGCYAIKITNKSDRTIYIDMSRTFRTTNDGITYTYYGAGTVATSGEAGSSTRGVGASGGSLSNGNSIAGTKTFEKENIVAIPSHGSKYLGVLKTDCSDREKKCVILDSYEHIPGESDNIVWSHNAPGCVYVKSTPHNIKGLFKGCVNLGEKKVYSMDDTPAWKKYQITYSYDSDMSSARTLDFTTYVKELVGINNFACKGWEGKPDKHSKKTAQENQKIIDKYLKDFNSENAIYQGIELPKH